MPRYLLTTQTLIDIAMKQDRPAERWIKAASTQGVYTDDLFLSAATPARVALAIQHWRQAVANGLAPQKITQDYLSILERNADQIINVIRSGGRLIPADEAILTRWADLLNDTQMTREVKGQTRPIESIERLEIATAAQGYNGRTYVLLAQNEPHLQRVNGLTVEDPAEVTPPEPPQPVKTSP